MIYIEPKEPNRKWMGEAATETQKIIDDVATGKPLKFKDTVWQKLKPFLKEQFQDKCAYCEGKYGAGSSLDVEHFRPKGNVKDSDHPGYYWLAYHWKNLLLSCEKCNRAGAKMDQFPISGTRASSQDDPWEEEKPLLLNPYEDKDEEIEKHIKFGVEGIIEGKTEKGRQTISICNLNREELRTARLTAFKNTEYKFKVQLVTGGAFKGRKFISNEMPFSAYQRTALKRFWKEIAKEVESSL